jgi:CheY-like chemotaxis protein
MAKIMLVEDDNNLREIYEARLLAEGYQIISAKDGEEALAVAVKEKPDLIISDVMMPKISGFDMLDILRTTPETKDVKIIMMTALSQAEDKGRADKLGADRYLVKSQVTLEDVAKVAHEVLGGEAAPAATPAPAPDPAPTADASTTDTTTPAAPVADPVTPVVPAPTSISVTTPDEPIADTTTAPTATPPAVEPASSYTPTTAPAVAVAEPAAEPQAAPADEAAVPTTEMTTPEITTPSDAPAAGPVNDAATDASNLADSVNQILSQPDTTATAPPAPSENTTHGATVTPLGDSVATPAEPATAATAPTEAPAPETLAPPAETPAVDTAAPETPAPAAPDESSQPAPQPGNVIQPSDPNQIAL